MELQIRVKNIRPQGCGGVIQLSRAPQTGAEVLSKVQSPRLDISHPYQVAHDIANCPGKPAAKT